MTTKTTSSPVLPDAPIACDGAVVSGRERSAHGERAGRVFSAARELDEQSDGYAVRFDRERVLEADLTAWIEDERRCCPFFRCAVERLPGGELWLRITGPEGAKAILNAGFDAPGPGVLPRS